MPKSKPKPQTVVGKKSGPSGTVKFGFQAPPKAPKK